MQSVKLVDMCIKRMRSLPRFPTNGHVQSLRTALTEGIDDNTQLIEISQSHQYKLQLDTSLCKYFRFQVFLLSF